jgi:hypothetical protein
VRHMAICHKAHMCHAVICFDHENHRGVPYVPCGNLIMYGTVCLWVRSG